MKIAVFWAVDIDIRLIALMMEAARTSETLANFYKTTLCYNPEDSNLQLSFALISTTRVQHKIEDTKFTIFVLATA
jgi:hypothetical protein